MRPKSIVGTLAWLTMLLAVQTAQAGRVVVFEVLVDGNVVMNAQLLDQGEDAETAWKYLKTTRVVNPADLYVVSEWFIDPIQVDALAKKRTVDPQKRTREQVDRATAEK